MNDTIHELINRILEYVARTPGADFRIFRLCTDEKQLYFSYYREYEGARQHFVSRNGDDLWLFDVDLTEDDLQYLVEQLENEE